MINRFQARVRRKKDSTWVLRDGAIWMDHVKIRILVAQSRIKKSHRTDGLLLEFVTYSLAQA